MFKSAFSLVLTFVAQLIFLLFLASLLMAIGVVPTIYSSILSVLIIWCLYLLISDYIFLYVLKVHAATFSSENNQIFDYFSFRNKSTKIKPYFSSVSPVFMRVGLFNGSKVIINNKLIKNLKVEEVRAYLDLELSYTNSLGSFVETMLQRLYLVSWYPLYLILGKLVGPMGANYFLSPMELVYRKIVIWCRSDFTYRGKFSATLPQIVFKVKIMDDSRGKIKLLSFAEKCIDNMLSDKIKTDPSELSRFEPDEMFR